MYYSYVMQQIKYTISFTSRKANDNSMIKILYTICNTKKVEKFKSSHQPKNSMVLERIYYF